VRYPLTLLLLFCDLHGGMLNTVVSQHFGPFRYAYVPF